MYTVKIRFDEKSRCNLILTMFRLIVYLIHLCLSLPNNLLSLAVFQGSKRIRRTSIGVYLTIYSIIAIVGNVILVVGQSVRYLKPYHFANNQELSDTFYCFLEKCGFQITALFCLWLSALVAFERGLIICFNFKMKATRWRSIIMLLFVLCVTVVTSVAWLIYRCKWNMPHQETNNTYTVRLVLYSRYSCRSYLCSSNYTRSY